MVSAPVLTGGGLAVPLETPVLREFACDWYFKHKQGQASAIIYHFFSFFPSSRLSIDAAENQCNIPAIAKLAGEIITAARILNALVSKSEVAFEYLATCFANIVPQPFYV